MLKPHFWIFILVLRLIPASAQLENPIFNGTFNSDISTANPEIFTSDFNPGRKPNFPFMALSNKPEKWGVQVLHYFKNNEYMEAHNPGLTLFGTQITTGTKRSFQNNKSHVYLGLMANFPFGGTLKTQLFPLVQFQHAFNLKHHLVLGTLHGNTRHNLYEPLYNYELNLTQPFEYGIQHLYKSEYFDSDLWLDWRQMAITSISQQEIISFGWSSKIKLYPKSPKHQLSIPLSSMVYHQGGESLSVGKPIANKWNGSIGIRYDNHNHFRFESVAFGSQDFSPQLITSFKDGHAWYNQIHVNPLGKHQLVLSHYYAEEFFAPFGPNLFLSEQVGNPYKFDNYRNFLMARYQWMGALIPEKCIFDFRVEPIWHIEKRQFAFSAGFYVKYVLGAELY
jgi:hypothetical protein